MQGFKLFVSILYDGSVYDFMYTPTNKEDGFSH